MDGKKKIELWIGGCLGESRRRIRDGKDGMMDGKRKGKRRWDDGWGVEVQKV